jgi:ABC-type dipeptide/oligopeptide/nickel transport system permease subunit
MSKILDQAVEAVRGLSAEEQDDIARETRSLALEAQGFKSVPGGYALRVSSPWMFGRASHYLATDVQIQEVTAARNTMADVALAALVSAIAVVVVLGLPAGFLGRRAADYALLWLVQAGITVLVYVQCCHWLAFRRLRPILARLPCTKE